MQKVILICAFLLTFTGMALADCPDDSWTHGGSETILFDNGDGSHCGMIVVYCFREATGGGGQTYFDVWIQEIRFIGNCAQWKYDFETDPREYYRMAFEKIVSIDPWEEGFVYPLCPEQTDYFWRFGHYTCFKTTWTITWVADPSEPDGGHYEAVKDLCPWSGEENQCWVKMTGCLVYENGAWIVQYTEVDTIPGSPCPAECESL
jgi:hypothetical protein